MLQGPAQLVAQAYRKPLPVARGTAQSSSAPYIAPAASGALPPFARLMADPLEGPLVGRPDDNSVGSIVRRDIQVNTITIGTGGNYLYSLGPGLYASAVNYSGLNASDTTVTTVAGTANTATYASLSADFPYLRPLAYVVEVRYIGAEQVAAGRLVLAETSEATLPNTDIALLFDNAEAYTGALKDGGCAVLRPYRTPTFAAIASSQVSNFPYLHIGILGSPLGQVVEVTITRVVELLPAQASIRFQDSVPCPCDMVACCIASNISGPATAFSDAKGYKKIVAHGLKVAWAALKTFAPPGYSAGIGVLEALIGSA